MKYLTIIIAMFFGLSIQAQQLEKQVISSTGSDVSAGGYQLSQTVGESVVETFTSGSFILGQGFQQVEEEVASSITDFEMIVDYLLFPNPTNDIVNLELEMKNTDANVLIELVDVQGRLIESQNIALESNAKTKLQFDLKKESAGLYFIKISETGKKVSKVIEVSKF